MHTSTRHNQILQVVVAVVVGALIVAVAWPQLDTRRATLFVANLAVCILMVAVGRRGRFNYTVFGWIGIAIFATVVVVGLLKRA